MGANKENILLTKARTRRTHFKWLLDISEIDVVMTNDEYVSPDFTLSVSDLTCCLRVIIDSTHDSHYSLQHYFVLCKNESTQFSRMMISISTNDTKKRSAQIFRDEYNGSHLVVSKAIGKVLNVPKDARKFTIVCEIKCIMALEEKDLKLSIPQLIEFDNSLQQNVLAFHQEKQFCDVIIHVNEESFLAHRLLLALSSPIFNEIFHHKIPDDYGYYEVQLDDNDHITPNTFQVFLEYAYGYPHYLEKIRKDEELCKNLIVLASKYQVVELSNICTKTLVKSLTVRNAVNLLILADLHGCKELREHSKVFVKDHINELKKSGELKELCRHPQLIYDIV